MEQTTTTTTEAPVAPKISDLMAAGLAAPGFIEDPNGFFGCYDDHYEGCALGAVLVGAYQGDCAAALRAYRRSGEESLGIARLVRSCTGTDMSQWPPSIWNAERGDGSPMSLAHWISHLHYNGTPITELINQLRAAGL